MSPWHSEGRGGKLRSSRLAWAAQEFVSNKTKQKMGKLGMHHTLFILKKLWGESQVGLLYPLLLGRIPQPLTTNHVALWGAWHCQKGYLSQYGCHHFKPCQEASAIGRSVFLCPVSTGLGSPMVRVTTTLGKLQNRDGLTLPLK